MCWSLWFENEYINKNKNNSTDRNCSKKNEKQRKIRFVRSNAKFQSREQEVADISRTLKLLSIELEIPIIALCQLNRNASRNEPTLADIRESGSIEQDADNVIFLYQEDEENNIVTVDLQKQRAGNIGKSRLKFNKINSEFVNLER